MQVLKFIVLLFFLVSLTLTGCYWETESPDDEEEEADTSHYIVRKPNIYIYPEKTMSVSLKLEFQEGGHVTVSEPEYGNGWQVIVSPEGEIDGYYNYLFYECEVPARFQTEQGWVVDGGNLNTFFKENLSGFGFSTQEIADFTEFWIPLFEEQDKYLIYPQFGNALSSVINLHIQPEPDNLLRLVYLVRKNEKEVMQLPEPRIPKFQRQGFYVTEWGVIYE